MLRRKSYGMKDIHLRRSDSDDLVRHCPFCDMYICEIPGYLVQKHLAECGGPAENWQPIEENLISDQRIKNTKQRSWPRNFRNWLI